jgi:DNA-binding NarL/FixJ family response regulator
LDALTFTNHPTVQPSAGPSEGEVMRGGLMKDQTVRLGPREQQIVELLLQGCDNAEIASQLNMARRTVKAHFNRLFLRFGITGGIKRVKLATLLYRRQACLQMGGMEPASRANVNRESSNWLPKA